MKKIFSLLLAAWLLLGLIPAGGLAQEEPITITLWGAWSLEAGMADMVAEFEAAHPDIHVEYVKYSNNDEGNIAVDVALMAGDSIDMLINYGLKRLVPRSEKGLFEPLNAYAEKTGYDVYEENGDPTFFIEGAYYGLPIGGEETLVVLNGDYLEKAGLSLPDEDWTTDDYLEYARAMTSGEGAQKVYGNASANNLNATWDQIARSVLGPNYWYKEDGTSNFDDPAFLTSLNFHLQMEREGLSYPYTEYLSTGVNNFNVFTTGQAAMSITGNSIIRTVVNAETVPEGFKCYFAKLPTVPGEENYLHGINPFDYLSMCANIPQEKKEACWTFMEWMATEGNVWLASVAHIPSWKKVDKEAVVDKLLGDSAGRDRVDIDSLMDVVLDYDAPVTYDTNLTGYSQLYNLKCEFAEMAILGDMTAEEALTELKTEADEVLAELQE